MAIPVLQLLGEWWCCLLRLRLERGVGGNKQEFQMYYGWDGCQTFEWEDKWAVRYPVLELGGEAETESLIWDDVT